MTDKNTLKQKLEETKAKIKSNSKDAHFADSLISDLLSIKGQLCHEPTIEYISVDSIVDEVRSDTFYIAKISDGRILYKLYGGYIIICDARMKSLYETLDGLISMLNDSSDDTNDDIAVAVSAIGYVLATPIYAFSDSGLTYKIATDIVSHIASIQTAAEDNPLPNDDAVANAEERDQVMLMQEVLKAAEEYGTSED